MLSRFIDRFKVMFKSITKAHNSLKLFRVISINTKANSRLIFTQKHLKSMDAPQNASLKNQFNKNSQIPNEKDSSLKKLLAIFASGALAYFSISYYLENRKSSGPTFEINYQSNNLPGKIKPSKSVNRNYF